MAQMIKRISKFALLVFFISMFTPIVAPEVLEQSEARSGKTTICHRTKSVKNPYRKITVSTSALNSGHKNHDGGLWTTSSVQGDTWGDIIPDETAGGSNTVDKNFTATGQAIWRGLTLNPVTGSAVCKTMTMKQFKDGELEAGQTAAQIIASIKDAEADEDEALLRTLGLTFNTFDTTAELDSVVIASQAVVVTTQTASSVTTTTATLNGSVKTDATALTCHFEYSANSGFDPSTLNPSTATSVPQNATTSRTVNLTGLTTSTKYFYRLVCHDSGGGDIYGDTFFFTTGTTYAITYDSNTANSGLVPSDSSLYSSSESANVRGNEGSLVKTGYTFAGWTLSSAGTGTVYSPSNTTTIAMSENRVLYAKWTATTFPVTFDSNTATSGTISSQTYTAGTSQALTSNAFSKTGFTFAGWATSSGGSVAYSNGQSITLYETTTVYAKWTAGTYAVTFDSNTATSGAMSNQSFTAGAPFALTTNGFTKTGFTFAGWATTSGGSVVYSNASSVTLSGATTLYAKWTAGTYTVTFDSNTATSGTMSNQSFTAGTGQTLTTNGFTKSGFTFNGWATSSGGGVVYTNTASITIYADLILYANWSGDSDWRIDYDGNSNTGGTIPVFQSVTRTQAIAARDNSGSLVRTGYLFDGWNTNSGGTGTPYAVLANITPTANTTLYAKWVATSFPITFDSNTATSGSMTNQTFTAGTGQALTAIGFTKTGFSFAGWATSSGGSIVYTDSQTVTLYETATVFAKWTAGTFILTFDSNTATSGSMSTQSFTAGTSQAISSNGFSKSGFTFGGWSSSSGGSVEYANGASLTIYASTTLYAIWVATYSVTYTLDGGSGTAPTESDKASGATFNLASGSGLIKSGFTFAGWSCNSGSTLSAGTSFTMPAAALTCVAQWTASGSSGGSGRGPDQNNSNAGSKKTAAVMLITVATTAVKGKATVTQPSNANNSNATGSGSTGSGSTGSTGSGDNSTAAATSPSGPLNVNTVKLSETTDLSSVVSTGVDFSGKNLDKVTVKNNEVSVQAKRDFSGKTEVTITTTNADNEVTEITATVIVLPLQVTRQSIRAISGGSTRVTWVRSPNAIEYEISYNGEVLCRTSATLCFLTVAVPPNETVQIKSIGKDNTESLPVEAKYNAPVSLDPTPEPPQGPPAPQAPATTPDAPIAPAEVPAPIARVEGVGIVPITVTENADKTGLDIKGADWAIAIDSTKKLVQGNTEDSSSRVVIEKGNTVTTNGTGFKPNTQVDVWVYSTPIWLGAVMTDENGNFVTTLPMPDALSEGEHTFQAKGQTPEGLIRSASVPITLIPAVANNGGRLRFEVYFGMNSVVITSTQKARINAQVKRALSIAAKDAKFSIKVVGWVQPNPNPGNIAFLSKFRANNVATEMKKLGLKGGYSLNYAGLGKDNEPKMRHATVVIVWNKSKVIDPSA